MVKPLEIAAGIIRNVENNQIFITQRPKNSYLAGCWEFPGGKIEANETAEEGLFRELQEEIGIDIQRPVLLETLTYQYPEKTLTLHFFIVECWTGDAYGKEGQAAKWLHISALHADDFPAANRPIVELIKNKWG
jgi:8-oxo-dGTP diphosphatase